MSVLRVAPVQHRGNPPLAVQSHFDLRIVDWFQPSELPTPPDAIQFGDATNPVPLSYMDWKDMDFGSSSCLVLPEISGRHFVLVSTKAFIFLLDGDSLGNAKMPLQALHYFQGKDALDDTAESHSAMTYLFAKGEHLIYASGGGNPGLVCFQLVFDGHTPRLSPKWQADISLTNACASPTVGFSNIGVLGQPEFNALVWIADIAENKKTGAEAFIKAYNALRTSVTTSESDCALAPCGDVTRGGGIPQMALRQYAGRHDRHASDSAKMGVRRLENMS